MAKPSTTARAKLHRRPLSPFSPSSRLLPFFSSTARNIARRFYSSVPFSKKRDLHSFVPLYTRNAFARARESDRFTFIYTNVYGRVFNLFSLSLSAVIYFTFFFIRPALHSQLQKRELYGFSNETHLIDIIAYHATIFFL